MCARRPRGIAAVALLVVGCSPPERREIDVDQAIATWRARSASAAAVAGAAGEGTEVDPEDGIGMDEGVRIALALNPALVAARRRAEAVAAGAEQEGAWANPRIEAEVKRAVKSVPDPWRVEAGVRFTVPLSPERGALREVAVARGRAARAEVEARQWAVREEVQRQWVRWSAERARVVLREGYAAATRPLFEAARRLAATGVLKPEEAAVLEIEAIEQRLALREATWRAAGVRRDLLTSMGLVPDAPVELRPSLGPESAPDPSAVDIATNPELAEALAALAASEAALRHAEADRGAALDIGPAYELDGGHSAVGLGVGLPIPSLDRNQAAVARAGAEREEAATAVELAARRLAAEVVAAAQALEAAQARLEGLTTELLPALDQTLEQLRELAAGGEVDPLVVRHLLSRDLAARLDEIGARADAGVARVRLRVLAGDDR